jgi:hypothetical protein
MVVLLNGVSPFALPHYYHGVPYRLSYPDDRDEQKKRRFPVERGYGSLED